MSFFEELKRRNVFKVGVAYLALGWVIIQVTDMAVPALNLPEELNSIVFYLGIIGLPFALFFAWAFELTPDGMKRTADVDEEQSITAGTGQKINYIIMSLMAFGLMWFAYDKFAGGPADVSTASETKVTHTSIAVLPFMNMSEDRENLHFSDGISEEILNVLAKIPDLHVTSRSSAFQFRGNDINIPTVAQKLGVSNILEGSVRRQGNRIRITAQLIDADNDKHLWSETYDRELDDVFAIQDEISLAIVDALKVHLLGDEPIVSGNRTANMDAYNAYLIGKERLNLDTEEDEKAAIEKFKEAIALDPGFADAYAQLAFAELQLGDRSPAELEPLLMAHIDKALSLDSNSAEAIFVRGQVHAEMQRYDAAIADYNRAITINPNFAKAFLGRSRVYRAQYKYLKMLADTEKAYALDPMDIDISQGLAHDYRRFWRPEDADRVARRLEDLHPNHPTTWSVKLANLSTAGMYGELTFLAKQARASVDEEHKESFQDLVNLGYFSLGLEDEFLNKESPWWDRYYYSETGQFDKAEAILDAKLAEESPEHTYWLADRVRHYITSGEMEKLRPAIREWQQRRDEEKQEWRNECEPIFIYAKQQSGEDDGVDTMLQACRDGVLGALKANYLCPCSWLLLVKIAILEGDTEEAMRRAKEWLDHGDSYSYLEGAALFSALKDHPDYPELVKRNNAQVQRQRDILAALERGGQ